MCAVRLQEEASSPVRVSSHPTLSPPTTSEAE